MGATRRGASTSKRAKGSSSKNVARTPFLNSAQLAPHYLRYIVAGEVAGAWWKRGGVGAAQTHLAHLIELSITQNMETASRYRKAKRTSRANIARERGSLEAIKSEPAQITAGRLQQCVQG